MKFTSDQKLKYDLRHYPIRPHVGVGGVIQWEDKILLIKRHFNPNAGKWAIPGGHLNLGETTAEGALRECMEETGLNLKIVKFASVLDKIDYDLHNNIEYHYVLIDYFMEVVGDFNFENPPKPVAQSDVDDALFVNIEQLNEYDLTSTVLELFYNLGFISRPI